MSTFTPGPVTEEMVSRFLSWRLPDDFGPDCGVSFKKFHPDGVTRFEPVGTNLLTAPQARAMLEHVLAATPSLPNAWLGPEGQVMSDDVYAEWSVVEPERAKLYRRAAPSLLTDATCRDAARYQWLREQYWNTSSLFVISGSKECVRLGTDCPCLERLDEAIDRALATSGAQQ